MKIKRIYEPPQAGDGYRVLVDRLWPRGLSKDKADIDLWLKEIAPSNGLRRWFGHDPAKWREFMRRYSRELAANKEAVSIIKERARWETTTLLFSAKDTEHNNAVALRDFLLRER